MSLRAIPLLAALSLLVVGCTPPRLVPASDPAWFGKSAFGFIRPGETTREEVLLTLGTPATRFEADRILTYLIGFEETGKAHLYAPRVLGADAAGYWEPETYSLVLVFRPDGVLQRYGLVGSK